MLLRTLCLIPGYWLLICDLLELKAFPSTSLQETASDRKRARQGLGGGWCRLSSRPSSPGGSGWQYPDSASRGWKMRQEQGWCGGCCRHWGCWEQTLVFHIYPERQVQCRWPSGWVWHAGMGTKERSRSRGASVGERNGPTLWPPSRMSPSSELTQLRSWQWSKSQGRCREVRAHPFPNTDHLPLALC